MRRLTPILAVLLLLALSACTTEPKETGHTTLTVFLDRDLTAERRSAVEQRLRSMPSVDKVGFETRDQAYERLKEQMKDSPDLLADLKPELMPESFHATVTDASIAEAVELVMGTVDGVQDVALRMSRPGFVGGSQPCEGRSHASTEEVPGRGP
jgi:cell division protein FtsX